VPNERLFDLPLHARTAKVMLANQFCNTGLACVRGSDDDSVINACCVGQSKHFKRPSRFKRR
jgi:hypothetical protein